MRRAAASLDAARKLNAVYGHHDDTPEKVDAAIRNYRQVMANLERQDSEAARHQLADLLMDQAQQLMRWRDFDGAERIVQNVRGLRVNYGPFEAKPEAMLEKIVFAKRQVGGPSVRQPEVTAPPATPESNGPPQNGVAAVEPNMPNTRALYDVNRDPTRNTTASFQEPAGADSVPDPDSASDDGDRAEKAEDSQSGGNNEARGNGETAGDDEEAVATAPAERLPSPGDQAQPIPENISSQSNKVGSAIELYRAGEQALKDRDVPKALDYFRQAYKVRNQLDPTTARRLQDHLQMLSAPAAGARGSRRRNPCSTAPRPSSSCCTSNSRSKSGKKRLPRTRFVKKSQAAMELLKEASPRRKLRTWNPRPAQASATRGPQHRQAGKICKRESHRPN